MEQVRGKDATAEVSPDKLFQKAGGWGETGELNSPADVRNLLARDRGRMYTWIEGTQCGPPNIRRAFAFAVL